MFLDLNKVLAGDLYLPWDGREWKVEEPAAAESERLMPLVWSDDFTADVEIEEIKKLLGHTWDDLIQAGISWPKLLHFGRTALIWATSTKEAAEAFWKASQFSELVMEFQANAEAAKAAPTSTHHDEQMKRSTYSAGDMATNAAIFAP